MRTATSQTLREVHTQQSTCTRQRSRARRRKINYGRATFLSFSLFFFLFVLTNVLTKIYWLTH